MNQINDDIRDPGNIDVDSVSLAVSVAIALDRLRVLHTTGISLRKVRSNSTRDRVTKSRVWLEKVYTRNSVAYLGSPYEWNTLQRAYKVIHIGHSELYGKGLFHGVAFDVYR